MATDTFYEEVNSWINGDEQAFKKLFSAFYSRLYTFASRSIKNNEEAEELAMNVLLKIWQNKFRLGGINDFESYLFGMLRQEIARRSRKKFIRTEDIDTVPLNDMGYVDHPELSLKELQLRYQDALDKLPEKRREVFLLSREQGMSQQQIADLKNLSVSTVNNHITSALRFLREEFQDCPDAIPFIILASTVSSSLV